MTDDEYTPPPLHARFKRWWLVQVGTLHYQRLDTPYDTFARVPDTVMDKVVRPAAFLFVVAVHLLYIMVSILLVVGVPATVVYFTGGGKSDMLLIVAVFASSPVVLGLLWALSYVAVTWLAFDDTSPGARVA